MAIDSATTELDMQFIDILRSLNFHVTDTAANAAKSVLDLSSQFLDEKSQGAVERFYHMYFSKKEDLQKSKDQMNRDVDRMMEDIRQKMEEAGGVDSDDIEEVESLKMARLSLSGIQKELETIIRLEEGIRDKLMPVLTSMQFEDMLNQRLSHIEVAWTKTIRQLAVFDCLDPEGLGMEIENLLSSNSERELFYETVYQKPMPEEKKQDDSNITGLF